MADFTGLLKKTIETQSVVTPQLRRRVYERVRNMVEKELAASSIPASRADLQRKMMEKAIIEVEIYYRDQDKLNKLTDNGLTEKELEPFFVSRESLSLRKKGELESTEEKILAKRYNARHSSPSILDSSLESREKFSGTSTSYAVTPHFISSRLQDANKRSHLQKTQTADQARFCQLQKIEPSSERTSLAKRNKNLKKTFIQRTKFIFQTRSQRKKGLGKKKLFVIIFILLFSMFSSCWIRLFFHDPSTFVKDESLTTLEFIPKITRRLFPDGQEQEHAEPEEAGKEKAVFFEEKTAALSATKEIGTVIWSSFSEKMRDNKEQMVICGDVSVPGKDIRLRMIIRRNVDSTIPASYLIELVFIIPKNFYGKAVEQVMQLAFKASEQSIGQNLYGVVPVHLDENFFVLAMNATEPQLNRNLEIMKQLPWIKLTIAYKNGRIGEFSFAKGKTGDAIFKQVLDNKKYKSMKEKIPETGQAIQEIIQKEVSVES